MKRFLIVSALLFIGCSTESSEPIAESAAAIGEPACATWAQAQPFREHPIIKAWYSTPCPVGMEVVICNGTESASLPDSCTWFDGQPYGIAPACCPTGDATPLTCGTNADCPYGSGDCWEPWCNTQTHQCMQTWAFKIGDLCTSGAVCNIGGMFRSDVDGLLISEQGWPAVCDEPQFPPARRDQSD